MNSVQEKIELTSKVKAILIELNSIFEKTNREISQKIGVSESFLSRVDNGKAHAGRQLFFALQLLLELETLKKENAELRELLRLEDRKRKFLAEPTPIYSGNEKKINPNTVDLVADEMLRSAADSLRTAPDSGTGSTGRPTPSTSKTVPGVSPETSYLPAPSRRPRNPKKK